MNSSINIKEKGFSTVEYIVLFIVLISSLMAMARIFKMFLMYRQRTSIQSVWGYVNSASANDIKVKSTGGGLTIK